MQAILDKIEKMSANAKTAKDADMDPLRRMAEQINTELVTEGLIRTMGQSVEASANNQPLDPASQPDGLQRSEASDFDGKAAARSNSSPYASQMRAYRENA